MIHKVLFGICLSEPLLSSGLFNFHILSPFFCRGRGKIHDYGHKREILRDLRKKRGRCGLQWLRKGALSGMPGLRHLGFRVRPRAAPGFLPEVRRRSQDQFLESARVIRPPAGIPPPSMTLKSAESADGLFPSSLSWRVSQEIAMDGFVKSSRCKAREN
jgi:hypothetical protein